jgi:hypothetical protein
MTACTSCTRDISTRPTTPHDSSPPICTICLEPLATTTTTFPSALKSDPIAEPAVTVIKCGHVFGRNCLTQWMQDSNTCPVCRVKFFVMPKAVDEGLYGEPETEYSALGVYAERSAVEHFSGLLISTPGGREADAVHERVDGDLDEERAGEVGWMSGGRRVYYA